MTVERSTIYKLVGVGVAAVAVGIGAFVWHKRRLQKQTIEEGKLNVLLELAEASLKKMETGHTAAIRKQFKAELESAYQELQSRCKTSKGEFPPNLENIASRIFYLYGRFLYPSKGKKSQEYEASRQLFELSLITQFAGLKAIHKSFLPNLKTHSTLDSFVGISRGSLGINSIRILLQAEKNESEVLIDSILETGRPQAFRLIESLRWVNATYQSIPRYHDKVLLFKSIFEFSGRILQRIPTEEGRWQLAQITSSSALFIHQLEHPNLIRGEVAALKRVFAHLELEGETDRAKLLKAKTFMRMANQLSRLKCESDADKLAKAREQYSYATQAVEISSTVSGINRYLLLDYMDAENNLALDCLKAKDPTITIAEIEEDVAAVLKAIKDKLAHGNYASYFITAARFNLVKGKAFHRQKNPGSVDCFKTATGYLDDADAVIAKHSISNPKISKDLLTIRTRLEKLQKAEAAVIGEA